MNILIVEDQKVNAKLLKFYSEEFLMSNDHVKFVVDIAENGLEAIGLSTLHDYDLMFLDVRMPKLDGIKVLNAFKNIPSLRKPYICMVTAVSESKYQNLFKLLNADYLITKPIDQAEVVAIVEKIYNEQYGVVDDIDFDEFDNFDDFEYFEDAESSFNSHVKQTAVEFLNEFDNIEYILNDIEEIDDLVEELVSLLNVENFELKKSYIEEVLRKYITFFDSLLSFEELSSALKILRDHINDVEIQTYDMLQQTYIVELIKAIFEDIFKWKHHVFVEKDATDVFYINASALNDCKQLETII
jgi:CheY-like chemotaxis protein